MDNILRNSLRIITVLIYPIILGICCFLILRKSKYKYALKSNIKYILINSTIVAAIITIGLIIFFKYENTIYSYDYAGHWIRALNMRKMFFEDPYSIFPKLYQSMNNADYSYLPAFFGLPFIIINTSYKFFCISNLILFLVPTFVLLQVIYYSYFEKNKFLPSVIFIVIFPLYLTLFYGKVDCCGLFFIIMAYALIILPKYEEIDIIDNLFVNLFAFLAIFLRRWYLYAVICLYISYLIKWLFYKNKKAKDILKLLSSGIALLLVIVLFFRPFLLNTINNNFEEAYAFYNNPGKLYSFFNNISPIICLVSLFGCIELFKKNKEILVINLVSIILPCILIWRIQSFEFHHYYIFLLNIIILFVEGLVLISTFSKYVAYMVLTILLIQPLIIFSYCGNTMPFLTNIRKNPEIHVNKTSIIELSEYLKSIMPEKDQSAFLSAGSYSVISDDTIRNALLPDLDAPNIDSSVFDIRDGFPRDMQYIKYVILVDPIVYSDENYQHMFTIIDNAIKNVPIVSSIYKPIKDFTLATGHKVTIYERTGEFTPEIKQYFYNEMLKYYPDKADFFKYILD